MPVLVGVMIVIMIGFGVPVPVGIMIVVMVGLGMTVPVSICVFVFVVVAIQGAMPFSVVISEVFVFVLVAIELTRAALIFFHFMAGGIARGPRRARHRTVLLHFVPRCCRRVCRETSWG
jgi:hypothetical protein